MRALTGLKEKLYQYIIRPILFQGEPEFAHSFVLKTAPILALTPLWRTLGGSPACFDPRLQQTICGIDIPNPVGIAAGFDKNGEALPLLSQLGFGFIEVGTVTPQPQPGNEPPRLYRFPSDATIINRLGFPSHGIERVAEILHRTPIRSIIGINVGKNKDTPLEKAHEDYLQGLKTLGPYAQYGVINISSPNTAGLRSLQGKEYLTQLLQEVRKLKLAIPLFVKIAPDLTLPELDVIIEASLDHGIDGIIATNTTLSREEFPQGAEIQGGLSGPLLKAKSLKIVQYLADQTDRKVVIIGAGGIRSTEDVLDFLRAGASLVQLYTAVVFHGPALAARICEELLEKIEKQKVSSLQELVQSSTPRRKGPHYTFQSTETPYH